MSNYVQREDGSYILRENAGFILREFDLTKVLGVCIHPSYGAYSNLTQVISNMQYLGLYLARTDYFEIDTTAHRASVITLAQAGIKFNFIAGGDIATFITNVKTIISAVPGSVVSIEGPNEVNNNPMTYKGLTDNPSTNSYPATLAYQADLYAAVQADSVLKNLSVYNFTCYPTIAGSADVGNIHVYPVLFGYHLEDTSATVKLQFGQMTTAMPGKPVAVTEFGISSAGLTPDVRGYGLTNGLTEMFIEGVAAVFLYELMNQSDNYGLFSGSVPTTAATQIKNLVLGSQIR